MIIFLMSILKHTPSLSQKRHSLFQLLEFLHYQKFSTLLQFIQNLFQRQIAWNNQTILVIPYNFIISFLITWKMLNCLVFRMEKATRHACCPFRTTVQRRYQNLWPVAGTEIEQPDPILWRCGKRWTTLWGIQCSLISLSPIPCKSSFHVPKNIHFRNPHM